MAAAAGELLEAPAPAGRPRRQPHLDDDLVGGERGGERALEEIGGLDHADAGLARDRDLGVAGHGDPRHFRRRIGMRDAAPDRAAVADLIVRDMGNRGLEQRMRAIEPPVVLDVAPAHHGAQRHAAVGNPDAAQVGELAQIDQQRRLGETEGEHRHQALAPGQRLRIAVMRGEKRDCLGQRGRACIVEGRQFHDPDASFALHAT
jgi:hypothetical protein